MKSRIIALLIALATQLFAANYPNSIDSNAHGGNLALSYDIQTWLSNAGISLIGLEPTLGLPSNPASRSVRHVKSTIKPTASGTIFWIGASYEDEINGYVISGNGAPYPVSAYSDGNSWAHRVSAYLGQPCIGRYTPQGNHAPYGTNYAVGGAGSFTGTYSIPNQIAQLISDYGGALPPGAIVVIGAYWPNDLTAAIATEGGVWAPPSGPQTWTVTSKGGFTIPSTGTVNVNVVSSKGVVANGTNQVSFTTGNPLTALGPFVISAVPDRIHITINTNASLAGRSVPKSATVETGGAGQIAYINAFSGLATSISNLIAALPSNGLLVIVTSPDVSLIPSYSAFAESSATAHNTWLWYKTNVIAPLIRTNSAKVTGWDMSQVLVDVVTNYPPANGMPGRFGFKVVNAGMGGTISTPVPAGYNASDWVFWDGTTGVTATGTHPTGSMHALYAERFIEFLKVRKLVTP